MTVPALRATNGASLIALNEFQLGFRPSRSAVVSLLQDHIVRITARTDLDGLTDVKLDHQMSRAVAQTGANGFIVVSYQPDPRHLPLIERLVAHLASQGVELLEHVMVGAESYTSLVSGQSGSLDEVANDPISVQRIYDGNVLAGSRSEIVAQLEAGSGALPEGFDEAFASTQAEMVHMSGSDVVRAVVEALDQWEAGQPVNLGRIAALGMDHSAVEPVLARIRTTNSKQWLAYWAEVVRAAEGPVAVLPLVAAGCSAWAAGEGALVNAAIDQLTELDRDHPMLKVLNHAVQECLPPLMWDDFAMRLEADVPGVPG